MILLPYFWDELITNEIKTNWTKSLHGPNSHKKKQINWVVLPFFFFRPQLIYYSTINILQEWRYMDQKRCI